jgi:hypothetical protein
MRGQEVSKLKKIDCVFIGSSRVMAAVNEQTFAAELSRQIGRPIQPFNLGLAYSTVVEHYLILRNLFREHPEQARGCTVFIEAPAGLPADPAGWASRWTHPDRPDILPPLLRGEDLVKAWTCGLPLEERLALTKDFLCRRSTLMAQRTRIATAFVEKGNRLAHRLLDGFLPAKPPAAVVADLTTRGGIRNDQEGVAFARQVAVQNARAEEAGQSPLRITEQSILWDLVSLVHSAGGRVVFFEMPLHSTQRAPLTTELRNQDRQIFHEQLRSWHSYYLANTVPTVDEDFPDIWHLRSSLAPVFSASLARSWAEVVKREGIN